MQPAGSTSIYMYMQTLTGFLTSQKIVLSNSEEKRIDIDICTEESGQSGEANKDDKSREGRRGRKRKKERRREKELNRA